MTKMYNKLILNEVSGLSLGVFVAAEGYICRVTGCNDLRHLSLVSLEGSTAAHATASPLSKSTIVVTFGKIDTRVRCIKPC